MVEQSALLPSSDSYSLLKDLDPLGGGCRMGKVAGASRAKTGSLIQLLPGQGPCRAAPNPESQDGNITPVMVPMGRPYCSAESMKS